jgi:hypothetical protein
MKAYLEPEAADGNAAGQPDAPAEPVGDGLSHQHRLRQKEDARVG